MVVARPTGMLTVLATEGWEVASRRRQDGLVSFRNHLVQLRLLACSYVELGKFASLQQTIASLAWLLSTTLSSLAPRSQSIAPKSLESQDLHLASAPPRLPPPSISVTNFGFQHLDDIHSFLVASAPLCPIDLCIPPSASHRALNYIKLISSSY